MVDYDKSSGTTWEIVELSGEGRHSAVMRIAIPRRSSSVGRHAAAILCVVVAAGRAGAQQASGDAVRQRALDEAMRALGTDSPSGLGGGAALPLGQAPAPALSSADALRLTDLSLDVLLGAGTSTEPDDVIGTLQGGGHEPRRRGFTLGQAELSIGGAVDPYFLLQANLVFGIDPASGETIAELEEAYATTQALPGGLQARAGMFLTEFGRMNPSHPHAWAWQDQPIALTRLFGGDGMRSPGARLAWLLPTANYTELLVSVQNADGEQMPSFLANEEAYAEGGIGGRAYDARPVRSFGDLLYTVRATTSWDFDSAHSTAVGASFACGPNATGEGADTVLYGVDAVYKWRPPQTERGWPFVTVEGEFLARVFDAAAQVDDRDPLAPVAVPGATLHDQGGYLQVLWGFTPQWEIGLRGEWVGGAGASYDPVSQTFDRAADPQRTNRFRLTPLLAYHPSEFSRLRLQYSYDDSDALADPAHSVWLGFEMLIGKHPPHRY